MSAGESVRADLAALWVDADLATLAAGADITVTDAVLPGLRADLITPNGEVQLNS